MDDNSYLTPREIVAELDKYIIGQEDAKKNQPTNCQESKSVHFLSLSGLHIE